jgi:uncharacterized protein
MLIHELTRAECVEILQRAQLGRLACARYDQPYVVPILFSFDSDRECVYSFSTIGQKIEWMRQNPKVCLEVEDIEDKDHWTTVVAVGRYEEIDQSAAHAPVRRRAEELFAQRREWWLPGAAKPPSREHHDIVVYRITLDRLSGRRASRQN